MTIYYAANNGTGNGLTEDSPFRIIDFLGSYSPGIEPVAQPGDTLYLLDGTYAGQNNMIFPPCEASRGTGYVGPSGTPGSPITIKALNDGKVLIDATHTQIPCCLNGNDWFVFEGFNVCNSGTPYPSMGYSVIQIEKSNHCTFRRICAWDAMDRPDTNNEIFGNHDCEYTLFEDCAGWGTARKIFQNSYGGDYTTYRRCFGRFEGSVQNLSGPMMTFSTHYNSYHNLFENCIATWDELRAPAKSFQAIFTQDGTTTDHPIDVDMNVRGCIVYSTADQNVDGFRATSSSSSNVNFGSNQGMYFENFLNYSETGRLGYFSCFENYYLNKEFGSDPLHPYQIVGPWPYCGALPSYTGNRIYQAIQAGTTGGVPITWPTEIDATVTDGGVIWKCLGDFNCSLKSSTFIGKNLVLNSIPNHGWATENNYLIDNLYTARLARGSVLQPGLDGTGAELRYRYEGGVLTDTPLWPWPMEDRIYDAMVLSGSTKPVKVTETMYALFGKPTFGDGGAISVPLTLANAASTNVTIESTSYKVTAQDSSLIWDADDTAFVMTIAEPYNVTIQQVGDNFYTVEFVGSTPPSFTLQITPLPLYAKNLNTEKWLMWQCSFYSYWPTVAGTRAMWKSVIDIAVANGFTGIYNFNYGSFPNTGWDMLPKNRDANTIGYWENVAYILGTPENDWKDGYLRQKGLKYIMSLPGYPNQTQTISDPLGSWIEGMPVRDQVFKIQDGYVVPVDDAATTLPFINLGFDAVAGTTASDGTYNWGWWGNGNDHWYFYGSDAYYGRPALSSKASGVTKHDGSMGTCLYHKIPEESSPGVPAVTWQANHSYTANDVITVYKTVGGVVKKYVLMAYNSATSGASEPDWVTAIGSYLAYEKFKISDGATLQWYWCGLADDVRLATNWFYFDIPKYKYLHMSFWYKLKDYIGSGPRIGAYAHDPTGAGAVEAMTGSRANEAYQWGNVGDPIDTPAGENNGWQQAHALIDTTDISYFQLFFNHMATGAGSELWIDDLKIEVGGLTHILRRGDDYTPIKLTNADKTVTYTEGVDYSSPSDPLLQQDWELAAGSPGCSLWHTPPDNMTVISEGALDGLPNGTQLLFSYYHTLFTFTDFARLSVAPAMCLSSPSFFEAFRTFVQYARDYYHPDGYYLCLDEFFGIGWDAICQHSADAAIANYVGGQAQIIKEEDPGKLIAMWSDMISPYELGALYQDGGCSQWVSSFIWTAASKVPHDIIINQIGHSDYDDVVPTINARYRQSQKSFADAGHPQMIANLYSGENYGQNTVPYYQARMRTWAIRMASCGNMVGESLTPWLQGTYYDASFVNADDWIKVFNDLPNMTTVSVNEMHPVIDSETIAVYLLDNEIATLNFGAKPFPLVTYTGAQIRVRNDDGKFYWNAYGNTLSSSTGIKSEGDVTTILWGSKVYTITFVKLSYSVFVLDVNVAYAPTVSTHTLNNGDSTDIQLGASTFKLGVVDNVLTWDIEGASTPLLFITPNEVVLQPVGLDNYVIDYIESAPPVYTLDIRLLPKQDAIVGPEKWVMINGSFYTEEAAQAWLPIIDRCVASGYTGIFWFGYGTFVWTSWLPRSEYPEYWENVDMVMNYIKATNIKFIIGLPFYPYDWTTPPRNMLPDVNPEDLAEGMPVKNQLFEIQDGEIVPVENASSILPFKNLDFKDNPWYGVGIDIGGRGWCFKLASHSTAIPLVATMDSILDNTGVTKSCLYYKSPQVTASTIWRAGHTYSAGDTILDPINKWMFTTENGGVSGSTEPNWLSYQPHFDNVDAGSPTGYPYPIPDGSTLVWNWVGLYNDLNLMTQLYWGETDTPQFKYLHLSFWYKLRNYAGNGPLSSFLGMRRFYPTYWNDQFTSSSSNIGSGFDATRYEKPAREADDYAIASSVGATVTFTAAGGVITAVNTTPVSGGSGYKHNTTISLQVNGGHGAIISATTNSSGVITAFNATPVAGGYDYTSAVGATTAYIFSTPADENNGWQQAHMLIDTFDMNKAYLGLIHGATNEGAEIWIDDIKIEVAALTHILRRQHNATPIKLTNVDGNVTYTEGVDYSSPIDSHLKDDWDRTNMPYAITIPQWHAPPDNMTILPGGDLDELPNGTQLLFSYYHTLLITGWMGGWNQYDVAPQLCINAPEMFTKLREYITDFRDNYAPDGYFFYYDEMPGIGWCNLCKGSATEAVVSSITSSVQAINDIDPGKIIAMWSNIINPYSPRAQRGNGWISDTGWATASRIPANVLIMEEEGNGGETGAIPDPNSITRSSQRHLANSGLCQQIYAFGAGVAVPGQSGVRSPLGDRMLRCLSENCMGAIFTPWGYEQDGSNFALLETFAAIFDTLPEITTLQNDDEYHV